MKNYYELLEVSENASPEVIEKAYKVLAKKYHPDIQPKEKIYWAENMFKEITEAYKVLSNNELRKEYDIKIGLNQSTENKYNDIYYEHEKLKQEFNNLKIGNESQKYLNDKKNNTQTENHSYIKRYMNSIGTIIYNETQKTSDERSRDFKALILTIIIISILLFVFWKVPFLKNLLFP